MAGTYLVAHTGGGREAGRWLGRGRLPWQGLQGGALGEDCPVLELSIVVIVP